MTNLTEKACIIYEHTAKGPKTSGNMTGNYYIAMDKDSAKCIGADISKDVLIKRLHQEYGYHIFDIKTT